ncbi:MAG: hypothetical protein M1448_01825 [Candidatus Marsarchaeota archaeon]|nr:hypothetical protein [Candidatus Marsarchaeota archaeon]
MERRCMFCNKALQKHYLEKNSAFIKRKFCGRVCSGKARKGSTHRNYYKTCPICGRNTGCHTGHMEPATSRQ